MDSHRPHRTGSAASAPSAMNVAASLNASKSKSAPARPTTRLANETTPATIVTTPMLRWRRSSPMSYNAPTADYFSSRERPTDDTSRPLSPLVALSRILPDGVLTIAARYQAARFPGLPISGQVPQAAGEIAGALAIGAILGLLWT